MTENVNVEPLTDETNQLVPVDASPVAEVGAPVLKAGEMFGFDAVADILVTISIDVGTLHLTLGDLADMKPGSVFELPKTIGEPFEIGINGTPVATGEVIVVENSSGIRILEVFEPAE